MKNIFATCINSMGISTLAFSLKQANNLPQEGSAILLPCLLGQRCTRDRGRGCKIMTLTKISSSIHFHAAKRKTLDVGYQPMPLFIFVIACLLSPIKLASVRRDLLFALVDSRIRGDDQSQRPITSSTNTWNLKLGAWAVVLYIQRPS